MYITHNPLSETHAKKLNVTAYKTVYHNLR